ncbi:MAG: hypothetical protein HY606_15650 [Planctomycetes bacterium]|nr:hypothetical protein [Planctomycetota bacterium]
MKDALLTIVLILCQNDSSDELAKIKEENARLKNEVEMLEQTILLLNKELHQLKSTLKELEKQLNKKQPVIEVKDPGDFTTFDGPSNPIKTQVLSLNPAQKFVVIGAGEEQDVKVGYFFDIYDDADLKIKIGAGEVQKILSKTTSKVIITEGDISDFKVSQTAIARRKMIFPTKDLKKSFKIISATEKDAVKVYIIDGGLKDNLQKPARFYVIRENKIVATIEAKTIEQEFSVCDLVSIETGFIIKEGDRTIQVMTKKQPIIGKILNVSERNGIYIGVGINDSIAIGNKFEVRRQGRKVGEIVTINVMLDYSICNPAKGCKIEDFNVDDFIEFVE